MTTLPVSLGLQGGGAYGAFTWGVLDRLLDDERLVFDAIGGTSAGAINAMVVADGMAHGGGRAGAKAALHRFWTALGMASRWSPLQRTPVDYLLGRWTLETSPGYHLMQFMSAAMAAMQLTKVAIDPMRDLLASLIDFERVRTCEAVRLFVHATNVRSGRGTMFAQQALTVQHLMAAICVPQAFAAVEIDGEAYWDGSYAANPALAPLVPSDSGEARDIIIVQINPVARQELPASLADINNRANEIAFNTSMLREVTAVTALGRVIDEIDGKRVAPADVRLHLISGAAHIGATSLSSKYNAAPTFLTHLHGLGVAAGEQWLTESGSQVGVRATLALDQIFHQEKAGDRSV